MHKYIYLFIIIFIYPLLGNELATCYSIQLRSTPKSLLQITNLPTECKVMQIGSYNTLRCGCYNSAKKAKENLKKYKKNYSKAILVQTYRYRFAKKVTQIQMQKKEKRNRNLTALLYKDMTFNKSLQALKSAENSQKKIKQNLLKNKEEKEQLLSQHSDFYGLSLQGKYEQYLNQNYRFREYTDYEYDLKLQFDLFKDGYFEHKKKSSIITKEEHITYIQNLSNILKNDYDEQLLIVNTLMSELNYDYFSRLQILYKEALKHRMNDYNNSLTTQNEIEELQQIFNRVKKSAKIYKEHQKIMVTQSIYKLLTSIENTKLQDYQTILKYAKENNPDIQLQKARLSLLDETPLYSDEMKLNFYAHRRMVDEMGWYNTIGVEAKLPLDFTAHERKKVLELEQVSRTITQESCDKITKSKLLELFQKFSDTQKFIEIDRDDIRFLQRRIRRYEIIEKNTIPNLNYNPDDKILKLSQNIIDLELKLATKKVELFKILSNIAYLSNTSDISYLIKGLK